MRTVVPAEHPPVEPRRCWRDWRVHGATVNEASFDQLMAGYEQAGFLYPAKRQRLAPWIGAVADAWTRMLRAGDDLRRVYAWERGSRWATLDLWRSAGGSWTVQHLVANGGGAGARATILAALSQGLDDPGARAWECWFRPSNPFPERVLGGSVRLLGDHAGRADHAYVAVPVSRLRHEGRADPTGTGGRIRVIESSVASAELLALAADARHHAFAASIGLDTDPLLAEADRRYRSVGLRRYRRVFLAEDAHGRLRGAALAHRGPTALNFSLLENRCDVLLQGGPDSAAVARSLLAAASAAYTDFAPGIVPTAVAIDAGRDRAGQAHEWAEALGGSLIQVYAQVVWLRAGLPALGDYFDRKSRVA